MTTITVIFYVFVILMGVFFTFGKLTGMNWFALLLVKLFALFCILFSVIQLLAIFNIVKL